MTRTKGCSGHGFKRAQSEESRGIRGDGIGGRHVNLSSHPSCANRRGARFKCHVLKMGCVKDGEEPHQMKDTIYGYAIEGHQIVRIVEALYVKSSIKFV